MKFKSYGEIYLFGIPTFFFLFPFSWRFLLDFIHGLDFPVICVQLFIRIISIFIFLSFTLWTCSIQRFVHFEW